MVDRALAAAAPTCPVPDNAYTHRRAVTARLRPRRRDRRPGDGGTATRSPSTGCRSRSRGARSPPCSAPTAPARPRPWRPARATEPPQQGTRPRAGPRPAARPARPAPPDRRHAAGRRRLERRTRRWRCCDHIASLHAHPLDTADARRPARPGRLRPHALPPALRRPAAAPRPGDGAGRATGAGVRRRADRRAWTRRPGVRRGSCSRSSGPTASRSC